MNWRMLLLQLVRRARSFEPERAGKSNEARIAIIAMTTRSSINVNAGPGSEARAEDALSVFEPPIHFWRTPGFIPVSLRFTCDKESLRFFSRTRIGRSHS